MDREYLMPREDVVKLMAEWKGLMGEAEPIDADYRRQRDEREASSALWLHHRAAVPWAAFLRYAQGVMEQYDLCSVRLTDSPEWIRRMIMPPRWSTET